MSQLILMVVRIDDLDNPETLTEVWRRAMPVVKADDVTPEHYLDGLEDTVSEMGHEAMRALMVEQWRLTDQVLGVVFARSRRGRRWGMGMTP